jgi:hypothetical protein
MVSSGGLAPTCSISRMVAVKVSSNWRRQLALLVGAPQLALLEVAAEAGQGIVGSHSRGSSGSR